MSAQGSENIIYEDDMCTNYARVSICHKRKHGHQAKWDPSAEAPKRQNFYKQLKEYKMFGLVLKHVCFVWASLRYRL